MATAKEYVLETVTDYLRKEDFAFTLTIPQTGPAWDVYHFTRAGRKGMLALRVVDGHPEVGFFRAGKFTEAEVTKALLATSPN